VTVRLPADPVRSVAFEALRAVREKDAYANLVLPGLLASRKLEARDAAFATELVYGTLRALGTYDAILGDCVDRPLDKLDPAVLDVLRLGTHQLLATRVGSHAAVDESVKLVREKVGHGPTGLVNAVLRMVRCGRAPVRRRSDRSLVADAQPSPLDRRGIP
jgi:16S rRNA (cytosine967-C5)-methyltransferase